MRPFSPFLFSALVMASAVPAVRAAEYCEAFTTPRYLVEIPLRRSYFGDLNKGQEYVCTAFKDAKDPNKPPLFCNYIGLDSIGTGITKTKEGDIVTLTYSGKNPEGQTFLVKATVPPKSGTTSIKISVAQAGSTDHLSFNLRSADCALQSVDLRLVQEGNDFRSTLNSELCDRVRPFGWEGDVKAGGKPDLFLRPSAEFMRALNQDLGLKLRLTDNVPTPDELYRMVYYWSDITRGCRFLAGTFAAPGSIAPNTSNAQQLKPRPVFVRTQTTPPGMANATTAIPLAPAEPVVILDEPVVEAPAPIVEMPAAAPPAPATPAPASVSPPIEAPLEEAIEVDSDQNL